MHTKRLGRVLAVDFGLKRCGMAISDPLQIAISPMETVDYAIIESTIVNKLAAYEVSTLVFGESTHKDGTQNKQTTQLLKLIGSLKTKISSAIAIEFVDESFSSMEAKEWLMASGVGKKKRKEKALVDKVSAVIILKRYLDSHY